MKMTKESYPALFHYIHRQIADVEFPATKQEVLDRIGDRKVYVDWDVEVPLRSFIEPIPQQEFSCAADFYCMMIAAL
ncbi:MAG: hypothetical protein II914_03060 [Clostridia bacterium]|nr:hypothetical protein [Clostridia bacterium]